MFDSSTSMCPSDCQYRSNSTLMQQSLRRPVYTNTFLVAVFCILLRHPTCDAFYGGSLQSISSQARFLRAPELYETKRESTKAKGFGKKDALLSNSSPRLQDVAQTENSFDQLMPNVVSSNLLKNIGVATEKEQNLSSTPEERAKQILRENYGMKSFEEQQLDAAQLARKKEEQKKWAEMKKKADAGDEFDLFSILPAPVAIAIDRFLKVGTAFCGISFVASGILIAVEAWSKSFGEPLSPEFDDFIVGTIEPNFTPGLLVLLSFSAGLGVFASLQLGSQGASYREK